MIKTIYEKAKDEILEQRKAWGVYIRSIVPSNLDMIAIALEQAQKQEKLLELYRKYKEVSEVTFYTLNYKTIVENTHIAKELIKQIKELEK